MASLSPALALSANSKISRSESMYSQYLSSCDFQEGRRRERQKRLPGYFAAVLIVGDGADVTATDTITRKSGRHTTPAPWPRMGVPGRRCSLISSRTIPARPGTRRTTFLEREFAPLDSPSLPTSDPCRKAVQCCGEGQITSSPAVAGS